MLRQATMAIACLLSTAPAMAQDKSPQDKIARDTALALGAQRGAMNALSIYDGIYTGTWRSFPPGGGSSFGGTTVHRVGPFLGGSVKVMEGRNYTSDGALVFNGMMVLSFDQAMHKYRLRIYANGRVIDAEAVMNAGGYYFDVPTPGDASFRRINIFVTPGQWVERVDFHDGAKPVVKEAELILNRVGESDWPLGRPNPTPVPPQ